MSAERVPSPTRDTDPTASRAGPGQQDLEQLLSGSLASLEDSLTSGSEAWTEDLSQLERRRSETSTC
ncbi:hypothetical protein CapIbe_016340 [Capra ibex]